MYTFPVSPRNYVWRLFISSRGSSNQTQTRTNMETRVLTKEQGGARAIEKIARVSVSPSCYRGIQTAMSGGIFRFNAINAATPRVCVGEINLRYIYVPARRSNGERESIFNK